MLPNAGFSSSVELPTQEPKFTLSKEDDSGCGETAQMLNNIKESGGILKMRLLDSDKFITDIYVFPKTGKYVVLFSNSYGISCIRLYGDFYKEYNPDCGV